MMFLVSLFLLLTVLPASAFDAATRRFSLNATPTTGVQAFDFSASGFSEDCTAVPCAAIFIVTSAIAEDTHASDAMLSMGFTDGLAQVTSATMSNNNVATAAGRRGMRNDRVIESNESTGVTGIASFYDWTTTGLRIDITDAFPFAYYVTIVIMGGDGFSAKAGSFTSNAALDGTTDVATVGFEPDALVLSTTRMSTINSGGTTYVFSMGVANNDGSSTQGSISCYSEEGDTTDYTSGALTSSQYGLQTVANAALGWGVQIGSWGASGFTVTTKGTALAAVGNYLALKFPGQNSTVVNIDTRTTVGLTSHTLGWKPLVGLVFGTLGRAYNVVETDSDAGQCMISSFTDINQYANSLGVRDGGTANLPTYSVSNDQGILMESNDGDCLTDACFRGHQFVEATSMDLNYTSVFTSAVRKWIGFAIEDTTVITARRRGPGLLQ